MSPPPAIGTRLPGLTVTDLGAGAVGAYLAASGDDNPLHRDARLARAAGLAGPPVPGMLVMGQFARLVEAWPACERIGRLTARFVRPVMFGGTLALEGRVVAAGAAPHGAIVRLSATVAGKVVAVGEADVLLIRA